MAPYAPPPVRRRTQQSTAALLPGAREGPCKPRRAACMAPATPAALVSVQWRAPVGWDKMAIAAAAVPGRTVGHWAWW